MEGKIYTQSLAESVFKLETNARFLDFQYDILGHRLWYPNDPTELVSGGGKLEIKSFYLKGFPKFLKIFHLKVVVSVL